jgi:ABC-2 type transport system ATP-binding protein
MAFWREPRTFSSREFRSRTFDPFGWEESMIEVQNITKRYGATIAVNNVSFKAQHGEIVGFLGPNGAGKSTTLKILTCYIVADSGKVSIAGHDVLEDALEVRRVVGYLPENTPLYAEMRVLDYLRFMARARQVPPAQWRSRLDAVVQMTGISPMLKKNVGYLSKGYRQRVGLAQAMLHDPSILIFDEPTSGLDPHQIIEIRQLIRDLGKTKLILFSSHIMQEISAVCTRLMVIKSGRLVANGTPQELMKSVMGGSVFRVRLEGADGQAARRLESLDGVSEVRSVDHVHGGAEFQVLSRDGRDLGGPIFKLAKDSGWVVSRLVETEATLENVYLSLTASRN